MSHEGKTVLIGERPILQEEKLVIKIPPLHVLLPGAEQAVTTIPLLRGDRERERLVNLKSFGRNRKS